jgi:hypothetical protein
VHAVQVPFPLPAGDSAQPKPALHDVHLLSVVLGAEQFAAVFSVWAQLPSAL